MIRRFKKKSSGFRTSFLRPVFSYKPSIRVKRFHVYRKIQKTDRGWLASLLFFNKRVGWRRALKSRVKIYNFQVKRWPELEEVDSSLFSPKNPTWWRKSKNWSRKNRWYFVCQIRSFFSNYPEKEFSKVYSLVQGKCFSKTSCPLWVAETPSTSRACFIRRGC